MDTQLISKYIRKKAGNHQLEENRRAHLAKVKKKQEMREEMNKQKIRMIMARRQFILNSLKTYLQMNRVTLISTSTSLLRRNQVQSKQLQSTLLICHKDLTIHNTMLRHSQLLSHICRLMLHLLITLIRTFKERMILKTRQTNNKGPITKITSNFLIRKLTVKTS